jgi:hypothetical protein
MPSSCGFDSTNLSPLRRGAPTGTISRALSGLATARNRGLPSLSRLGNRASIGSSTRLRSRNDWIVTVACAAPPAERDVLAQTRLEPRDLFSNVAADDSRVRPVGLVESPRNYQLLQPVCEGGERHRKLAGGGSFFLLGQYWHQASRDHARESGCRWPPSGESTSGPAPPQPRGPRRRGETRPHRRATRTSPPGPL